MEQRRVIYEITDKAKIKELKDYKVIDEVKDDGHKYPMKLITFTRKGFTEPFYFLNCFDPSTGREYFLQTNKQKCWEAKSQSFGFEDVEWVKEW
jgi:hypothetical protein